MSKRPRWRNSKCRFDEVVARSLLTELAFPTSFPSASIRRQVNRAAFGNNIDGTSFDFAGGFIRRTSQTDKRECGAPRGRKTHQRRQAGSNCPIEGLSEYRQDTAARIGDGGEHNRRVEF